MAYFPPPDPNAPPQSMFAQPEPYQSGGMFGGRMAPVGNWLGNNSNALMMAGMGLMSGSTPQQGFGNAMRGVMAGQGMDRDRRDRKKAESDEERLNAALQELMQDQSGPMAGLSGPMRNLMMADPEFARSAIAQRMKPADMPSSYEEYQLSQQHPGYGDFLNQGKTGQGTDDMRELSVINQEREANGLPPYRLDEWITTRAKAGSTGIQLPAEMGARIGMGDQFLSELNEQGIGGSAENPTPNLRERVKTVFGGDMKQQALSRTQLQAGMGEPAEIWRRVKSGQDALVRQLTGAGMAVAEAQDQASRYSIGAGDSVETMLSKLDGLEADLKAVREGAIGARSGSMAPSQQGGDIDPLGIR